MQTISIQKYFLLMIPRKGKFLPTEENLNFKFPGCKERYYFQLFANDLIRAEWS